MIDNYLDFVKAQRKDSLQMVRWALNNSKGDQCEFLRGYDRGMRIAFDIEARNWRKLQKDIEAINKKGKAIFVVQRDNLYVENILS